MDSGVLYVTYIGLSYDFFPFGQIAAFSASTYNMLFGSYLYNATFSAVAVGSDFYAAIAYHRGDTSTGLLYVFDKVQSPYANPPRFIADLPQYLGPVPPVLGADGVLYVSSPGGDLYAVNPTSGAIIATGKVPSIALKNGYLITALAVAPGQLLVSMSNTAYTAVYALGSAPEVPSDSPSPNAAADLSAAAVASISVLVTAAVATITVFALIKVGVLSTAAAKKGDFAPLLETTSLRVT